MRRETLLMGAAAALGLSFAGMVAVAQPQPKQPQQVVTPPKASYWVSATTGSGLMGMMGAAQQGGGMMAGMRMARQMMSGGGVSHQLELDLGSTLPASGVPQASHTPAAGLGVRGALPLETPQPVQSGPVRREQRQGEPQRPRGRLLIFWGCGEHARAGQPVIIDFAHVAQGQWPTGLSSVSVNAPNPPNMTSHRTYGHWPNSIRPNGDAQIQGTASLLGEHLVRGNYTPDIRFTASQDFMAPINFTTNAKSASGAVNLVWAGIPGATGYAGWTFGAKGDDMIYWSTSETKAFGVYESYIPPGEAARLVRERALLAPTTTQCTVPVEVMDAIGANAASPDQRGGGMLFFTAYGPEQNIIYPERPADPHVAWNQEWFVKVRHRSQTMQMLGQSMGAMAAAGQDGQQPACPPQQPSMGSVLGQATGIPGAGAIGGALGHAFGKKKQDQQQQQPANPDCPR